MRVMCADDEVMLLDELVYVVSETLSGAEIDSFDDPKKAMSYAKKNSVDIAFLDINMGPIEGIDVAKELQKVNPKVNIIFCTGYTEYALDALGINCSGYLMKPITTEKVQKAMENLRYPLEELGGEERKLEVQCFGNFDALVDGVSVKFKYRKSRELLAYLIDRRGSLCTRGEISTVLFEDDNHDEYLTKLRRDIIDTFRDLGFEDVLNVQKGQMGINKSKVSCDYFDYMDRKPGTEDLFRGEYMTQYSFGEETLALLISNY